LCVVLRLKKFARHIYDGDDLSIPQNPVPDITKRRIVQNAIWKHYCHPSRALPQKLKAPFDEQNLRRLINLMARHKLPAVYPFHFFATSGGLISYGPDYFIQYRLAAGYIDRILKGENPADLPVQVPTKFELVINLKTAKALGLTIPETLLATADEVIQ
jgi:hypothetical protein